MAIMKEKIKFEFCFTAEFWDQCPIIDVCINNHCVVNKLLIDQKKYTVDFFTELECNREYLLSVHRYNKFDSQCVVDSHGVKKDQYVILDRLLIDGIDIQNLTWHNSWYCPEYSDSYQQSQKDNGILLEYTVPGELWWSHNGIWNFKFYSPFYKFVINQFK